MTHPLYRQAGQLPALAMILLLLGLWGCASEPARQTTTAQTPPVEPTPEPGQGLPLNLPPSEFSQQFSAAEASLARFDWMTATVTLERIPAQQMSANDSAYSAYLQARIAYIRGDQQEALVTLEGIEFADIDPALRYRTLNFRRHILEMSGDNLGSAMLADQILRWAPQQDAPALRRAIWRDLLRMDTADLQSALSATTDPQWRGWLELALMCNAPGKEVPVALSNWRNQNPDHPAAQTLPGGLGYQMQASAQLDTVALLLPLSNRLAPAGKAVRDGYLASYFMARAAGSAQHKVLVLDLDTYDSALTAYDDALAQGANLVVGPLSKESVAELGMRPDRPVPVLALNRLDHGIPASGSALVQLSLAPEDEAARIADLAYGRGARSALILRPAGSRSEKLERALKQRWSSLGGTVADSVTYSSREDYSPTVKAALDIDDSEKRARNIRDMLATSIEFTARRRQDPDVVFLLSKNGSEARSIKPLLAFHYAGHLPVYAISSIYSGIPDRRDRDLDGIHLVETPWLLGANPSLRVAIAAGDTGSDNYTRLNALGADAFLLQTRFSQLQAGQDVLLKGNTGLLSMDPQLHIRRELFPATFDGGKLQPQSLN